MSRGRAWIATAALLAWALPTLAGGAPAAVSVEDDLGQRVALGAPARRIVSLAPHLTELAFAAGAGERLVGVSAYSDFPPEARSIPRVGGANAFDLERILALRPDLVLVWESGGGADLVERLRGFGLPVFVSEPRRLEEVAGSLERLGRLAGTEATAATVADEFRRRQRRLAERYRQRPPVRVFYQIWDRPLMTVNGEHLISQVIELCGGRNVFAGLDALAPTVDPEAVLARDPEVILTGGRGKQPPAGLDYWEQWPQLRAVARNNLFHVDPDAIHRNGPRVLDAAEEVCRALEIARGRR